MHANDFNAIVEAMFDQSRSVLVQKADEYATDDRLHNFKVAAALTGETTREALAGMMVKHTVSIYDMCRDEKTYSQKQWDEKIGDHLNYLLLLKAIVIEEMYDDDGLLKGEYVRRNC